MLQDSRTCGLLACDLCNACELAVMPVTANKTILLLEPWPRDPASKCEFDVLLLQRLKKTCVRQVVLDKWFPPSLRTDFERGMNIIIIIIISISSSSSSSSSGGGSGGSSSSRSARARGRLGSPAPRRACPCRCTSLLTWYTHYL